MDRRLDLNRGSHGGFRYMAGLECTAVERISLSIISQLEFIIINRIRKNCIILSLNLSFQPNREIRPKFSNADSQGI